MNDERTQLSRREREMMDIIFRLGRATAMEVMEAMADPPSYSAVRATLTVLEKRGHLQHAQDGNRYVYAPTTNPEKARRSALRHLIDTFFEGSPTSVVATLLNDTASELSKEELERLSGLIDQAKKEGR